MEGVFPLSTQYFLLNNSMGKVRYDHFQKSCYIFSHFLFATLYSAILLIYSETFHHNEIRLSSLPVTTFYIFPIENTVSTLYILETQDA